MADQEQQFRDLVEDGGCLTVGELAFAINGLDPSLRVMISFVTKPAPTGMIVVMAVCGATPMDHSGMVLLHDYETAATVGRIAGEKT